MVERDLEFWQIDTERNFCAENLLNWLENKYYSFTGTKPLKNKLANRKLYLKVKEK